MAESIIKTAKCCFFCGSEVGLERHHCAHGTANRKLAEKYGLWVYLCPECHRGTDGVHGKNGKRKDITVKKAAQYAFMKTYDRTEDDFRRIFGKSYLGL